MRKIDQLLSEYGESHQNSTNKLIHWICVPLIFWSIVAMIWSIPSDLLRTLYPNINSPFFNWATIALLFVSLYYLRLSFRLFIGMALLVLGFLYLTLWVDVTFNWPTWQFGLLVFVLAWVGQFYGHKVEGKKPSFFKDLQFLLIGPAWLMHFVYKKAGIGY